ncbi:MAG: hypothetical protein ABH842_02460 [Candidatus Micrarchaeota archaeon]
MLLVEYLEEASEYIKDRMIQIQKLERKFHDVYDRDLKRETMILRREVSKKRGEVIDQLLLNLDEFRALHKYHPELLSVIMEDKYVGPIVSKKAWLLDFNQVPPQEASVKLEQLVEWRMQIKAARESLRGWVGKVNARAMDANFPVLRGFINKDMMKADALDAIKEAEKVVLREGWLLLISDSLIQIPIAKFMTKINHYTYEQNTAKSYLYRVLGKGTVVETAAQRRLEEVTRKKERYERILRQILLTNPSYLRKIKQKKAWLSKEKPTGLEKFVQTITPHTLRERAWLNEMKRKFS